MIMMAESGPLQVCENDHFITLRLCWTLSSVSDVFDPSTSSAVHSVHYMRQLLLCASISRTAFELLEFYLHSLRDKSLGFCLVYVLTGSIDFFIEEIIV
jgi:hypothetical protein